MWEPLITQEMLQTLCEAIGDKVNQWHLLYSHAALTSQKEQIKTYQVPLCSSAIKDLTGPLVEFSLVLGTDSCTRYSFRF